MQAGEQKFFGHFFLKRTASLLPRCNTPNPRNISPMEHEKPATQQDAGPKPDGKTPMPKEIGGPKGPEPTRFGDWEVKGRCTDF